MSRIPRVVACLWAGALTVALANGAGEEAHASLVKPSGSPPLDMPNALALEMAPEGARSASLGPKNAATCAASAVRLGQLGTRLITARHCAANVLEVFDEHFRVVPAGRTFVSEAIDIAILDVEEPLPWAGLEPRRSSTLTPGERLCAWRFDRGEGGLERQRICGRFVGWAERTDSPPLLKLSHPYPPGTSGSALVDTEGHVAGVVVASNVDSGLAEPIDSVLSWAEARATNLSRRRVHARATTR